MWALHGASQQVRPVWDAPSPPGGLTCPASARRTCRSADLAVLAHACVRARRRLGRGVQRLAAAEYVDIAGRQAASACPAAAAAAQAAWAAPYLCVSSSRDRERRQAEAVEAAQRHDGPIVRREPPTSDVTAHARVSRVQCGLPVSQCAVCTEGLCPHWWTCAHTMVHLCPGGAPPAASSFFSVVRCSPPQARGSPERSVAVRGSTLQHSARRQPLRCARAWLSPRGQPLGCEHARRASSDGSSQ